MKHRDEMKRELDDRSLLKTAAAMAFEYLDGLEDRPVYPGDDAIAALDRFDEQLPDGPRPGAEVLDMLHRHGSPATVATTAGRYFGFVNGGTIPTAGAARWLADVWDQNASMYVMSPVSAKLEDVCERWSADLLGLAEGTAMGLVSGTSTATLCGLAAGRWRLYERAGYDVNARGLYGAPPLRVVVSEQAHGSLPKALALLGLGHERVEVVPADEQGRMRAEALPALDDHTIVLTQAGHVATGAFDPFAEICAAANAAGAWVHVDGAFGLWAAASPRTAI